MELRNGHVCFFHYFSFWETSNHNAEVTYGVIKILFIFLSKTSKVKNSIKKRKSWNVAYTLLFMDTLKGHSLTFLSFFPVSALFTCFLFLEWLPSGTLTWKLTFSSSLNWFFKIELKEWRGVRVGKASKSCPTLKRLSRLLQDMSRMRESTELYIYVRVGYITQQYLYCTVYPIF